MIWIVGLPLPPSANTMYETNVHKRWIKRSGKAVCKVKTSRRKSDRLITFQTKCQLFKMRHRVELEEYKQTLLSWIKDGNVIVMDSYCVFEQQRIWTKDGNPKQIDADNFRKALQDMVFNILGIDDKYCFRGNIEKVTCIDKDLECSIVGLRPAKPRTLEQIKQVIVDSTQPT
jgi:hypothetical protein